MQIQRMKRIRNIVLLMLPGFLLFTGWTQVTKTSWSSQTDKLYVNKGLITFVSKAPLERIEASSSQLKGIISKSQNTFAFNVPYASFIGFNSPLQQEHFNENFMESDKFEKSTFSGRIIDPVSWVDTGVHMVRVKGVLDIHGVKQERILTGQITVEKDKVLLYCKFPIQIADHNITIPKVLNQKIAEEVTVTVAAQLEER